MYSTHKVNHLPKDRVLQNQTGAKLYDQHETETHVARQLHLNASAHEEARINQIIISRNYNKLSLLKPIIIIMRSSDFCKKIASTRRFLICTKKQEWVWIIKAK